MERLVIPVLVTVVSVPQLNPYVEIESVMVKKHVKSVLVTVATVLNQHAVTGSVTPIQTEKRVLPVPVIVAPVQE